MPNKPSNPKGTSNLRSSIIDLKCKRMSQKEVVSLTDYRLAKQQGRGRSILVVDSDELTRQSMKRSLESDQFSVEVAHDALSLSDIVESGRLDLIFLDIDLPWVNGIELCQLLKGHATLSNIPIVLTSDKSTKALVEQGFIAGCDDFLAKPFNSDDMVSMVFKIFGDRV